MTDTTINESATQHSTATNESIGTTHKPPRGDTIQLRRDNPRRPVSWRWQRAELLYESGTAPIARLVDEHVVIALRYLQADSERPSAQNEPLPSQVHDAIRQAHGIWQVNGTQRWLLEAWLLTGVPMAEVADKLSLPVEAVVWYERLFFDTRNRLQVPGIITHAAIGREIHTPTPQDVGAFWRLFGYHLGPLVLQAVVDDFMAEGRPDYSYLLEPPSRAEELPEERQLLRQLIRVMLLPAGDILKMLVHTLKDQQTTASVHTLDGLMDQLAVPGNWARYAATGRQTEKAAENVGQTPQDGSRAAEAA